MKFLKLLFPAIISSVIFYSCGNDGVTNNSVTPQDNFTYPYDINSYWYYGTRNFVTNLRPDSLKVYFPADTLKGYGGSTFVRDTVIKGITLRYFRNSHSDEGHSHATLELYNQTDSGLIRHAFYSNGTNFGPFRPDGNLVYSLNGISFGNLNDLVSYFKIDERNTENKNSNGDTVLIFDKPPITTLKYPVQKNYEWLFYISGTTKLTKKYTDYEYVNLSGNSFYCIKIQKQWYMDNSQTPDSHFIFYDYFSDAGMVKREFTIKDIQINNQKGQLLGYIDAKDEAFLNFFTHP
jgi:hypothetical protein